MMDLHTASSLGLMETIRKEIQRNPDSVLKVNCKGWTPIMYACSFFQKAVVELFTRTQPSCIYSVNFKRQTPLMIAVEAGNLDIVKLVFKVQILDFVDCNGWTALFYAVYYGHIDIACFLIKCGSNINIKDNESKTALTKAMETGQEMMVEILIMSGAEHNDLKIDLTHVPDELKSLRQKHFHLMILLNFKAVSNLDDFLTVIGLDEYIQLFFENHIDFDEFLKLTETDLKKIGVFKLGPRRKMSLAISKYIHLKDLKSHILKN